LADTFDLACFRVDRCSYGDAHSSEGTGIAANLVNQLICDARDVGKCRQSFGTRGELVPTTRNDLFSGIDEYSRDLSETDLDT